MNHSLRLLLSEFISHPAIVASWGMTQPTITDHDVSFNVNGFKYEGRVSIIPIKDGLYEVRLGNTPYSDISLQCIIKFLDCLIERTDSYLNDISNWL